MKFSSLNLETNLKIFVLDSIELFAQLDNNFLHFSVMLIRTNIYTFFVSQLDITYQKIVNYLLHSLEIKQELFVAVLLHWLLYFIWEKLQIPIKRSKEFHC